MTDARTTIVARGYDALGEDYVAWAASFADPARRRMLEAFSARMAAGARVLDIGCGPGVPSTKVLANRFEITGVDISETQLDAARRNVPEATFVLGDLMLVDFAPGSFAGVTAFYSIIHVPREDHARLFERVSRWLVPSGLFLATLSATDDPDWTGDWLGQPMFFSGYEANVNRELVAAANFDLLIDDIMETPEPEGPALFLWILAQRSD
jgi:cyclopropane fatty-acyl-phospholipid synthase-like methyltransferase